MQTINFLFSVVILIMSVVIHEVSHGFAAYKLGDPTAKYSGRLTLNPIKHLDFVGSFLVPLLTYSVGGFIFGWAKPVPYNPYNLKNQKWGPAIVGAAGPLANITVALFFGLMLRFNSQLAFLPTSFFEIIASIALINLLLAIFNLIPIPPLDGSKLLFAFLPYRLQGMQQNLERFGFFFLLIFITFFWQLLLPIVFGLFKLLTGVGA